MELNPDASTGTLDDDELNCIEGMKKYNAGGLHPGCAGMAVNPSTVKWIIENDIPVRMWTGIEPLFGQSRRMPDVDLRRYALMGTTDIITNAPERYLNSQVNKTQNNIWKRLVDIFIYFAQWTYEIAGARMAIHDVRLVMFIYHISSVFSCFQSRLLGVVL